MSSMTQSGVYIEINTEYIMSHKQCGTKYQNTSQHSPRPEHIYYTCPAYHK